MLDPIVEDPQRPAWAPWISPETLISQVVNTAPFLELLMPAPQAGRLIDLGSGPQGYLRILANWRNMLDSVRTQEEQLQDYFALCLACHHGTVASFVPTDVDTKIRGILWCESRDPDVLKAMLRLSFEAQGWSQGECSRREIRGVSGHNGEHWSAIAGALGRFLELGVTDAADAALAAIEHEIDREQAVLDAVADDPGAEVDLLMIAMSMAHNRGDLTQGMSFWRKAPAIQQVREHLTVRGKFAKAVKLYQDTGVSAEGHRHYPLRPVKALRRSADTLLPLPPFLDDWGTRVVRLKEASEVLEALVVGCRKIEGQQGYYRAIAGMQSAGSSRFQQVAEGMSNSARKLLREPDMRKKIDVSRASFESMMRKRARTALG